MISSSARLSRRYPMPPRTAVGNNRGRGARPLEREKANQALNATTTKAVRIADIVFEWRFHRLTVSCSLAVCGSSEASLCQNRRNESRSEERRVGKECRGRGG